MHPFDMDGGDPHPGSTHTFAPIARVAPIARKRGPGVCTDDPSVWRELEHVVDVRRNVFSPAGEQSAQKRQRRPSIGKLAMSA